MSGGGTRQDETDETCDIKGNESLLADIEEVVAELDKEFPAAAPGPYRRRVRTGCYCQFWVP